MRRVLRFLMLGFCVTVAMVLDEGDGVALPVVSDSETRSRGQERKRSDDVWNLETASGHGRLKDTCRRRQDHNATPSP
ncbi:hypothetical protein Tco_1168045 [Tanacetum coccineum]